MTRPFDQPVACELRECRTDMLRMQANVVDKTLAKSVCDATLDPLTVPSSIKPKPNTTQAMSESQQAKEANEWVEAVQRPTRSLEGYIDSSR